MDVEVGKHKTCTLDHTHYTEDSTMIMRLDHCFVNETIRDLCILNNANLFVPEHFDVNEGIMTMHGVCMQPDIGSTISEDELLQTTVEHLQKQLL
jgi:hypothetical protein